MKCAIHPDKDASILCNHCGRSICSDCLVTKRNENYCRECASGKAAIKEKRSAPLAGVLSFIIAGLGQVYNGQVWKGLLIFFTSLLVVPWILGIFDAYATAKKINRGEIIFKPKQGCLIAFAVGACLVMVAIFFVIFIGVIAVTAFSVIKDGAREAVSESGVQITPNTLESYGPQWDKLRKM